jgi:hypothetical protein
MKYRRTKWGLGGTEGGEYIQSGINNCSPKDREQLEELGADGRRRVHWTIKKLDKSLWNGLL